MITKGMVGFSNNKVSFLGRLIRFFTDSHITHTFITTFPKNGEQMIEEASTVVWEGSFKSSYVDDPNTQYWMFKIKDGLVAESEIDAALQYCHDNFLGVQYGRFQLLYFTYRWFMETFFNKDLRHGNNWFTKGVICSELVYYYLHTLGGKFRDAVKDFSPDTIQAQDVMNIVVMNPDLFEFVEKKE